MRIRSFRVGLFLVGVGFKLILPVILLCAVAMAQDRVSELSIAALSGGASHRIAPEQSAVRDVAWSDSRHIAWLNDLAGDVPAAQLWAASADGGNLVQLADLKGYAQTPRYSPDGAKLAVLFIEDMPRVAGPLQPMTPLAGVVGSKIYEQRIAVIDLGTKKLTQVSPADVYVYEYEWLPDSQGWVATAAHGSGDNNWWIARLYRISAGSGELREIYKPKWQIAEPHISPDGKLVAFIEGLMSDEGSTGEDVQVVPITGGTARNLTPASRLHSPPLSGPRLIASVLWRMWTEIPGTRSSVVLDLRLRPHGKDGEERS